MQEKNQNVFLNSWSYTFLLSSCSFACGLILWFPLMMIVTAKLPNNPTAIPIWATVWAVFWLWFTESAWFALTCRRFAQRQDDKWLILGAFGRVRYRFKVETPCDYTEIRNGQLGWFRIWEKNGAVRRFNLTMCADGWEFVNAIQASPAKTLMSHINPKIKRNGLHTHYKHHTNIGLRAAVLTMSPFILLGILADIWGIHARDSVWQIAATISFLLCALAAAHLAKEGFFNDRPLNRYPKHIRHWRLYMEEVRFHFMTIAIGLFGLVFVTFSCAMCLAMFSLWNQPWQGTYAQAVGFSGTCGRYGDGKNVETRFPEYADFNGRYCSYENIREGEYRYAEVQSGRWGWRVRFGGPYQPK